VRTQSGAIPAKRDVDVPRFACVDGPAVGMLLMEWLRHPDLRRATLISFAVNTSQPWADGADAIRATLAAASEQADVTIVTSDAGLYDSDRRAEARRRGLEYLMRAGVRVLIHNQLHAKVFLLEQTDQACWVVGSSNLTLGGLSDNAEANLRGFHPGDFNAVRSQAETLVAAARPF